MKKNIIIIAGPTASGKSSLAIDVAKITNGVIVNADSMQVYKDTPIISACPDKNDKQEVEHRLYEIYDSSHHGTVNQWLERVKTEIEDIWLQGKTPVVTGGTGMYINILINGMSPIPETPEKIKLETLNLIEEIGINELHKKLCIIDPVIGDKLEPNDTTRVRRAYEVFSSTGKSLSDWHKEDQIKIFDNAKFYVIKILPEREELYQRCNLRFDLMLEKNALNEIIELNKKKLNKNLPAMKAIGVPPLLDFINGKISKEEAIEKGKTQTRQYAKRQNTWFKNQLKADIIIKQCYKGEKNIIKNIVNMLKTHDYSCTFLD